MELLDIVYQGKELSIKYEIEDQSECRKITCDYYIYAKNGHKYTIRQSYGKWELLDGVLKEDLANIIIDTLIYKYESKILALCYYDGKRQLIRISNLEYTGQDFAYSLMVNNIDLGDITYKVGTGWEYNLRVKLNAQWFGTPEIDIIIEMIENGDIPWLKGVSK
ncbi:hypothetical protein [Sphingobacterium paramultivorum]|uniref:hypothetical protein n=1 Tax=Sphingobacterium paramultivorum TaxID=2886510 RepID=UPI00129C40BC|nr:hypothetical protein [Sphingobacterium paramultivorum]